MRIVVHRGTHEIGGSCIEIATATTRIILDVGSPLDQSLEADVPASARTLFDADGVKGIFLSHAHGDHSGLISRTPSSVPVWLSKGTSQMLMAGRLFARMEDVPRSRQNVMVPFAPIVVGDLTVTALPVDHSIADAVSFVVEGEGKRIFYTGDLRFHGRKPGMARRIAAFLKTRPVDVLLIEGTRLGARAGEPNLSESDLEDLLVKDFSASAQPALLMYSPLNLDRYVTAVKSCLRSGRTLVVDPYQAFVIHLLNRPSLPVPGKHPRIRLMVPPAFSRSRAGRRISARSWFQSIQSRGLIGPDEIRAAPGRYAVLYRPNMSAWLFPEGFLSNTQVYFMYWPGYLKESELLKLREALRSTRGAIVPRHASGHAHPEDLIDFAQSLSPKELIPVHTAEPHAWSRVFPRTRVLADGEPIEA